MLTNSATASTRLVGNFDGSSVILSNTNTGANSTPLDLRAAAGRPPMKVNSTTKVANLNADQLDGLDSSAYQSRAAMAIGGGAGDTSTAPAPLTAPVSITVPAGQNFVMLSSQATWTGTADGNYVTYWAVDADCSDLTGYFTAPAYDSINNNSVGLQSVTNLDYLFHLAPGAHTVTVCGFSNPQISNYNATVVLQTVGLNGTGGSTFAAEAYNGHKGGKVSATPAR